MIEYGVPIIVIAVLIVLNGLFVAAEFAIIGVPRATIEQRAARGSLMAGRVLSILRNPRSQDRYIATAQLGITFASLGLGMYGEHQLAHWIAHWLEDLGAARWIAAHTIASVIAIAVLTYFHIVVGEMVPKAVALQQPVRAAIGVTPIMLAVRAMLYPLVIGLNGVGNAIVRLLGVDRQAGGSEQHYTSEDLEFVVEESVEGGLLYGESARVLRSLFDFGDTPAEAMMVPRVRATGIRIGAEPRDLTALVQRTPHTRYPVYYEGLDEIAGMVHMKDVMRLLRDQRPLAPRDVRPVPFLPQSARADSILTAMHQYKSQLAVVLDEYGGTAGIVTMEDLFEEVIGEIDERADERVIEEEGRLIVPGTIRLDEVGDRLGVTLEHPDVNTVNGLILLMLNRPPIQGDSVVFHRYRFSVIDVRGRAANRCAVTRAEDAASP